MRLATVFIFYVFEGVPMGLFYFAIPAFMAGGGADAADIAAVVAAFALPWSLKLVNGFFMDRYTYLPMGRRRIWIIGSQATMAVIALTAAFLAPIATDVAILSVIAFTISLATTFQDVSIDSLVVDILDEEEQAKAGGIMFGAQILGVSLATAVAGRLLQEFGTQMTFMVTAVFLSIGILYAVVLKERPGERRFPWSEGSAHPRNLDIKIAAWWPLLKKAFSAMLAPVSLILVPFLLLRNVPGGVNDVYNPIIANDYAQWTTVQYTDAASLATLAAGIAGLFLGGPLVAKVGARKIAVACFILLTVEYAAIGMLYDQWNEGWVMQAILWASEFFGIFLAIALIPLAMQACSPAVAATQFTIYMAIANFGRPIGAWLTTVTTGDDPRLLYFVTATIMALCAVGMAFVERRRIPTKVAEDTGQGAGAAAYEN